MNNIRRISFLSGPGAGKSTISSWVFAELKMKGYDAEHVAEYCKAWAFIGRSPTGMDQLYILSKQLHKEDIVLRNNKSIIISESPLFLAICYARKNNVRCAKHLLAIVNDFEEVYPSLNIFIDRGDIDYKTTGRFQNYAEAIEMDNFIKKTMDENGLKYHVLSCKDKDKILELCEQSISV